MAKINSNSVTFVDLTESRKLEIHIKSNLPTTQIRNLNNNTYTPDWSATNLILDADIFLDSKELDTVNSIKWYKKVGTSAETQISTNKSITISANEMSGDSASIITYICKVTYQNLEAQSQITFARTDTGLNGSDGADGADAPAVVAQYSVDGSSWTATLNTAIHKYIRYSYDGGKTYTAAIKMVGEDGTSVAIKGTATSVTPVSGTDYYTLVYNSSSITSAGLGDSYLYNGDLYVCADSRDGQDYFINVGNIQGPSGQDGQSSYVFIRYATDSNGTNMSTSSSGKTYMGVYVSNTNTAPTTASVYTWSKFVGDNAKNIILNAAAQVFKVDKFNAISPATISVTAQAINTTVTNWTYSTDGGQTFLSTVPNGVTRNNGIVTITGSKLTTNSITIKASDGQIEDVFTVYKVIDGSDGNKGDDGTPAPMVFLTNENITFSANANGQITGTSIISNVVAYSGATKVTPTIGTISGAPNGMTITSSEISASNEIMLTITIDNNATLGSASSNMGTISIPITSPVVTVLYLTWSKVNAGATGAKGASGADAYTTILTNESHIFAGDVSNAIAGMATTQLLAYKGTTAQTVTITSVNGKTAAITDVDTGITGLKFKCSALSGTSPTITFTCTTSFVSANGTIPIVFTVDGVSFTKIFAYSIAFKGDTGDPGSPGQPGSPGVPATSYWLISSASAVQKTSTGTITVTPSTLTFTSKSQTGTATPTDYACRWIIAYSTDGTNYTNLYTSSSNEASKTITVATNYKTIRARMYLASGTSTLLDEQIIPVVSDGAKGDQGNGINSVTITYGESTSASEQPTSWQSDIPDVAEDSYLWTRTVTDYTDNSVADTVTYTYAKQGKTPVKGTDYVDGTSVTVSSIQYQEGSSATTAPTGTWGSSVVAVAEGKYLWTKTTFSDGKVAYGVSKQGKSGSDAYTVILTNESHIFAGTVSTAVASSATTQVMAYKGGASQSVTIVSVNGKAASTSSTATGIAGLSFSCSALSGISPTITFSCTTSFVSPSGTIPIVLTVDGVTVTKIFTYGIAFKGTVGTPASLVDITPSALYFKSTTGKDGIFTPDYIYLYPRFQTVTYSKWEYSTNGGTSWTTVASGSNGLSIGTYNSIANSLQISKTSALYTNSVTSISFRCVSSNSSVYDTVTIAKIYDVVDLDLGVTFQLYAPKGYLITNETPEIILQAFAYEGSKEITSATFKWSVWNGEAWSEIANATESSLTINKTDVMKTSVYKCEMTYNGEVYESTATIEDKTDIYESLIRVTAKRTVNNSIYWILTAIVYSEEGEKDVLLGPVSETAPTNPTTGSYWYQINQGDYSITLKKYSGTEWVVSTDKQELLYDWLLFKDPTHMVSLGDKSKVKIIKGGDFVTTCNVQCNIFAVDNTVLSRNNQVLNDPTDPIVSEVAPANPIDGQIWIKIGANNSYILSVWNTELNKWILSSADTQNKVYVTKPSQYNTGDLWIVDSNYSPTAYENGIAQSYKHPEKTMLRAIATSQTYSDAHWTEALKYQKELDGVVGDVEKFKQFISIDDAGLIMQAKGANNTISDFKTMLTNTELGFYQGATRVAYINNNQLNISKAEITNGLTVSGTTPTFKIGNFTFIQESNGSLSIG